MNSNNKGFPIDQVKAIDMVSYLFSLGFEPVKIVRDDHWYLSPLRQEKTASFKINSRINRWYDHGMGKGGNLIDFGILFFKCSLGEFLKDYCGNISLSYPVLHPQSDSEPKKSKITNLKEQPLHSTALLHYLKQRKIPIEIASKFCQEVHYSVNDNSYYGIGFKNDLGGFEIRNPYFKSSNSPKAITTYGHNNAEVLVFEGFFDFLAFKTLQGNLQENNQDFIILNSLSFIEKARPFMEKHQHIRLFLDRDQAGENATSLALGWSDKYKDESNLYKNHKDLNQWVINCQKLEHQKIKPKLKL